MPEIEVKLSTSKHHRTVVLSGGALFGSFAFNGGSPRGGYTGSSTYTQLNSDIILEGFSVTATTPENGEAQIVSELGGFKPGDDAVWERT